MDITKYPKAKSLLGEEIKNMIKVMFEQTGIPTPETIDDQTVDTVMDAILKNNPRPIYKILDEEKIIITIDFNEWWTASINNIVLEGGFINRLSAEEFAVEEAFKMLEK